MPILPPKSKRTNSSLDYLRGNPKPFNESRFARKEARLSLIKRLVIKKGQYHFSELQKDLYAQGVTVAKRTLSRDIARLKGHRSFIVAVHVNTPIHGRTTVIKFRTKASPAS